MNEALARQTTEGGRFGDHLVALGHISQEKLDAFIHNTPVEPDSIEATGLDETELVGLLMKLIYTWRIESAPVSQQGVMVATYQVGYRVGLICGGAGCPSRACSRRPRACSSRP